MELEELKCVVCKRFPQAAETWVNDRICTQCATHAAIGRAVERLPNAHSLENRHGVWIIQDPLVSTWRAPTPLDALKAAGLTDEEVPHE